MKLSFSTLGCPAWSIEQAIDSARQYGFSGIEIRGIDNELDIRNLPEFSDSNIEKTRAMFDDAGIEIISVDSSASFSHKEEEKLQKSVEETRDYITLAGKLGAPLVRVFGGSMPDGISFEDGANQLASYLIQLGDFAAEKNVIVALETHDSFLTGKAVLDVMKKTNHESVGVVWDISNCFWTGESIEDSANLLAPYIKNVHIKDSILDGDEAKLVFIGQGDIPIQKALKLLRGLGYDGYLSYEWEKVWQPDLAEPEEAFPQYVDKMNEYLGELS